MRIFIAICVLASAACAKNIGPSAGPTSSEPKAASPCAGVDGIELQPLSTLPKASPQSSTDTEVSLANDSAVDVLWDWVGFDGQLVRYATVPPHDAVEQPTYVNHVWVITCGGERLGWFAAPGGHVNVTVH